MLITFAARRQDVAQPAHFISGREQACKLFLASGHAGRFRFLPVHFGQAMADLWRRFGKSQFIDKIAASAAEGRDSQLDYDEERTMRFAHKLIAASLLAATSASPAVGQTSTIDLMSYFGRRNWNSQPCQPGMMPGPSGEPTQPTPTNPLTPPGMGLDPGAQASLAGTGGGGSTALPQSIGAQGGPDRTYRQLTVPTSTITTITGTTTTTTTTTPFSGPPVTTTTTNTLPTQMQANVGSTTFNVLAPIASRTGSGFKIGDNESPVPMDRWFFTYNGYYQMQVPAVPPGTVTSRVVSQSSTTTVNRTSVTTITTATTNPATT